MDVTIHYVGTGTTKEVNPVTVTDLLTHFGNKDLVCFFGKFTGNFDFNSRKFIGFTVDRMKPFREARYDALLGVRDLYVYQYVPGDKIQINISEYDIDQIDVLGMDLFAASKRLFTSELNFERPSICKTDLYFVADEMVYLPAQYGKFREHRTDKRMLVGESYIVEHGLKVPDSNQIYVKSLVGKTIMIGVSIETSTVEDVKIAIKLIEGIPYHEQRLIFAGRQLMDDLVLLRDVFVYDPGNPPTLNLVLTLRGGGCPMGQSVGKFANLSESNSVTRTPVTNGYNHLTIYNGLNFEAKCDNPECVTQKTTDGVTIVRMANPRQTEFNSVIKGKCKGCDGYVIAKSCVFLGCSYRIQYSMGGEDCITEWRSNYISDAYTEYLWNDIGGTEKAVDYDWLKFEVKNYDIFIGDSLKVLRTVLKNVTVDYLKEGAKRALTGVNF